jgi:drug/metabolite transporter (DMT)-like permease
MQTLEQVKRWLKIIVGFTLLGIGAAMLVLPGPGIVAIALGLTILSVEYVWARRLLDRVKRQATAARDALRREPR